jgi:hypothetical protein
MRSFKIRLRTELLLIPLIALGLWAEGMRQRAVFCSAAAVRNVLPSALDHSALRSRELPIASIVR